MLLQTFLSYIEIGTNVILSGMEGVDNIDLILTGGNIAYHMISTECSLTHLILL